MTAIDLSAEMLNLARKEVHRINRKTGARITLRTIVKPIQACGLPDQSTDLAVAAYVLQYARQSRHPMNTGEREIEHIILETNRILTPQGFWIVALPYNISRAMIERFQRVVGQYGFDVLPTSGFYRPALAQDADGHTHAPTSSFRGVWIIVAQKQTQMTTLIEPAPIGLSFQPITLAGGVTRRGLRKTRTRKLITPERIVAFRHESGRSLDTLASRAAADPPRTIRDDRIVR